MKIWKLSFDFSLNGNNETMTTLIEFLVSHEVQLNEKPGRTHDKINNDDDDTFGINSIVSNQMMRVHLLQSLQEERAKLVEGR